MEATIRHPDRKGRPVIFIHGAAGVREIWLLVARRLESMLDDAPFFLLELPGHGATPGRSPETLEEYGGLVADYLSRHVPCPGLLVGHSMGGAISRCVALTHPGLVAGMVLVSSGPALRVSPDFLAMLPGQYRDAVSFIRPFLFAPETRPTVMDSIVRALAACDPETAYRDFLACDQFDVTPSLPRIRTPAVALTGEADMLSPVSLGRKLEGIPGCRQQVVPGAGHMLPVERPREVAEAIADLHGRLGQPEPI